MMNDCEDNGEKTNDPDLSDMNIFKPGHIDMNTGIHILDRKWYIEYVHTINRL